VKGYVDLHCHVVPGVDDGARTVEEGLQLCRGLFQIGFSTVVATPHVRAAMFDNSRQSLVEAYDGLLKEAGDATDMPRTALSAEYFCNDVFWQLFERGEVMPYPGGNVVLLEFPAAQIPLNVEQRLFQMNVRGMRVVVAHPERHPFLFRSTDPIDRVLQVGALALLDLMSLAGKHGKRVQRTAERMLDEEVYHAACSDAHRPEDVEWTARGIERLSSLVGEAETSLMLADNPRRIIEGHPE
jgi:protein-tyrosine phosphatase